MTDLAQAHLLALQCLERGGKSDCFNLGNEKDTSVLEIIEAVKRVTGKTFKVTSAPRREGNPPYLVGSSENARHVLG